MILTGSNLIQAYPQILIIYLACCLFIRFKVIRIIVNCLYLFFLTSVVDEKTNKQCSVLSATLSDK